MDSAMTDLPEGFVLEKDAPKPEKSLAPPPGFVLEGAESDPSDVPERGAGWLSSPSLDQGLTMGFSDEIAGAARAVGPILTGDFDKVGEAYSSGRADELARLKQDETENPVLSTVAEIGGGLVSGGALRPSGAAATKLGDMFTRMPKWLQSSGLGAIWAGIYGTGTADEGQRLKGGATGVVAGAATGAAFHGVVKGVQAGSKATRGYFNAMKDPEGQATRLLGEKMRADEITPARVAARLKNLGPQATIADAGGENVLGLARGAAGQPGPAKNRIMSTLDQRAQGESTRVTNALNKNLAAGDYFATEDKLLTKLGEQAGTAYRAAYTKNPSVMTPTLNKVLKAKPAQKALSEAAFIADVERAAGRSKWVGPVDKELTDLARYAADLGNMERVPRPGVAKGFSLETWDYVKRGIDSLLDKPAYRNELTGRLNKKGAAVNDLRKALVRALDKATGGEKSLYSAARKQYGDTAEAIGALRDGAGFFKAAPEQIRKTVDGLSDAGKVAYRNGAARAILDIVEKTPDNASIANRLFNKSMTRSKINAVFPSQVKFHDFSKKMVAEQKFAKTKNLIGSGSRTAPMSAEIADVQQKTGNIGAVLGSMMPGGGHALVKAGIGRRAAQGLLGSPDEMNKAIARMLVSRNRSEQSRILDALAPHAAPQSTTSPLLRGAIMGTAQQEGAALSGLYGDGKSPRTKTLADYANQKGQ